MSTTTPKQNPFIRRISQVYVEIPPSPLTQKPRRDSNIPHVPALDGHLDRKENTHIRPSGSSVAQPTPANASDSRKRKLSAPSVFVEIDSPAFMKVKKAKVLTADKAGHRNSSNLNPGEASNTAEESPNKSFYCHQCSKKRDAALGIQCTFKGAKEHRCKVKFCKSCLANRYGENMDIIKTSGESGKSVNKSLHFQGEGYTFKCPRCRDVCNCSRCRKAKGLEPIGNLTNAARKAANSTALILQNDPKAASKCAITSKGVQAVTIKNKSRKDANGAASTLIGSSKLKPRAIPVPAPKWSKLTISISLAEAEMRFNIREFVLRFAPILDVARGHLEELEEIGGSSVGARARARDEEEGDMTSWVSEPCVKSIVLGLLQLFAEEDAQVKKSIKDAMREIRASGANLHKIWTALSTLRSSLADMSVSYSLNFPDPLPPPTSAKLHNTRQSRATMTSSSGIFVVLSAQLVPVISAIIDAAFEIGAIRAEIDDGVKEGKERMREGREAMKKENERWEKEKVSGTDKEAKYKRSLHKQNLLDYEHALKVAVTQYALRCGPLGTDSDGRVYWALSPGVLERETATELIVASTGEKENATSRKSARRLKKLIPDEDDREEMRRWSWFVAVWGRKPVDDSPGAQVMKQMRAADESGDESEEEEDDDDEEMWWGFWDAAEIRKLAAWVETQSRAVHLETTEASDVKDRRRMVHGALRATTTLTDASDAGDDGDDSTSQNHVDIEMDPMVRPASMDEHKLKSLVKGLKDYAELLEYRIKGEETASKETGKGSDSATTSVSAKGRSKIDGAIGAVSTGSFYR